MRYAETGFNLEVDLTRGNIERVATDPKLTPSSIWGGWAPTPRSCGTGSRPRPSPSLRRTCSSSAPVCWCGTPAIGCNRTIVSTISPQTRLMAFSMMGGFWAPGAEVRRLRQGDPARQVPRAGLPVDPRRQGGDPRRLPPARARAPSRPRSCIRQELERAQGPGGLHRPGRREPGLLRLHRAGPVQRQPRRHRRRDGRQGPQGHRRARDQGHQHRPPGRVHGAVQRGAGVHQGPQGQTRSRASCPSWPGSGRRRRWRSTTRSGTPRTSPGATPATAARASGPRRSQKQWTDTMETMRTRLISCHNCPMKCGGDHLRARAAHLHDEVLLQAHLHHGGHVGPGLRPAHRPEAPPSTAWTASRPRRSWPSPSSCSRPAS